MKKWTLTQFGERFAVHIIHLKFYTKALRSIIYKEFLQVNRKVKIVYETYPHVPNKDQRRMCFVWQVLAEGCSARFTNSPEYTAGGRSDALRSKPLQGMTSFDKAWGDPTNLSIIHVLLKVALNLPWTGTVEITGKWKGEDATFYHRCLPAEVSSSFQRSLFLGLGQPHPSQETVTPVVSDPFNPWTA